MNQKNDQRKSMQSSRVNILIEEAGKVAEKKNFWKLSDLISDFKNGVNDNSGEAVEFIMKLYDKQIEKGQIFAVVIQDSLDDECGRNEEIIAKTSTLLTWMNKVKLQYMLIKIKKEENVCFSEDFATKNFMEIAQARRKPRSKLSRSSVSFETGKQSYYQSCLDNEAADT